MASERRGSRDRNEKKDYNRNDRVKSERSDSHPRRRSNSPYGRRERIERRRSRSPQSRTDPRGYNPVKREGSAELEKEEKKEPPVKPNYSQSGVLSTESKKDSEGNVLKYHEPEDSIMPPKTPEYRIYIFSESKEGKLIDTIRLNQKSCYLLGRDAKVCDIPIDIRSCSRQHAVIQFRRVGKEDKYGEVQFSIRPYIIDLESSYGTQLNHKDVPASRYVELRNKDLIQFCGHKREYIWMED